MEALGLVHLCIFVAAVLAVGAGIVSTFIKDARGLTWSICIVLLGFFVSVWAVYIMSAFVGSQEIGLVLFDMLGLFALLKLYRRGKFMRVFPVSLTDALVLVSSIAISFWIMFKPLHAGAGGMFLIGTNEVFDYGHALSMIRSFSQGENTPYSSPFIAGSAHVYHFLFYFWAGLLERFGLPIDWAFNLPSVVALSGLLMMVYTLAKHFFKSTMAGFLAMYFTLTHSTLMFWYFLTDPDTRANPLAAIWTTASYYFAGPYDGSLVSIFWTLNVFANQRHLVFGMAIVLVLYYLALHIMENQKKNLYFVSTGLGVLCGLLLWWHLSLFLAATMVIAGVFLLKKNYKVAGMFIFSSVLVALVQMIPWINRIPVVRQYGGEQALFYYFLSPDLLSWFRYWWLNLGFALVTIPIGFFLLAKEKRAIVLPFFVLFFLANVVRVGSDMTENHKFINLTLVMGSILSAGCLVWFAKKGFLGKAVSLVALVLLSFSGIIDAMVLKNDFQYPVPDFGASPFMRWVSEKTSKDSVFLSYQDIFDPITISGRKTYFGFFGARAFPERSIVVRSIYEATGAADLTALSVNKIDYVVVPKWKKDDFFYIVSLDVFREQMPLAYEDDRHIVFAVP